MTQRLRGPARVLLAIALSGAALASGPSAAAAQGAATPSAASLIDRLAGEWVMTGTIGTDEIVHDVTGDWILGGRYLRLHEVSRERDADGGPAYEAWILIAWDPGSAEYVVMWLDNTGTTNFAPEGVGHGRPAGDRIPFVWRSADGSGIHNTFAYDRADDAWAWTIDNVDRSGTTSPFARVRLRRK